MTLRSAHDVSDLVAMAFSLGFVKNCGGVAAQSAYVERLDHLRLANLTMVMSQGTLRSATTFQNWSQRRSVQALYIHCGGVAAQSASFEQLDHLRFANFLISMKQVT